MCHGCSRPAAVPGRRRCCFQHLTASASPFFFPNPPSFILPHKTGQGSPQPPGGSNELKCLFHWRNPVFLFLNLRQYFLEAASHRPAAPGTQTARKRRQNPRQRVWGCPEPPLCGGWLPAGVFPADFWVLVTSGGFPMPEIAPVPHGRAESLGGVPAPPAAETISLGMERGL